MLKSVNFSDILRLNENQRKKSNIVFNAQSWTALFRAFSSHRQPSASLTKLFPNWTRLLAELDKPGSRYDGQTWKSL